MVISSSRSPLSNVRSNPCQRCPNLYHIPLPSRRVQLIYQCKGGSYKFKSNSLTFPRAHGSLCQVALCAPLGWKFNIWQFVWKINFFRKISPLGQLPPWHQLTKRSPPSSNPKPYILGQEHFFCMIWPTLHWPLLEALVWAQAVAFLFAPVT